MTTTSPTVRTLTSDPTDLDPTDATTLNQRWCNAFNAGDVPAMMAMYEPDSIMVPAPGAEPLTGLEAIEVSLRGFLGLGGTLTFVPRHVLVCGDLALGSAVFVMDGGHDDDGNPVPLSGVTSEVSRRQADGTWKYVIDHPFGGVQ